MSKHICPKNHKWLLLVHRLPAKPTSVRVKVWRRVQNIGAVPIKNSVYVLPFTREASEDFQWLRQEIITQKGDATIFRVDSIDGMSDQDIVSQFQKARDKAYNETISKALKLKGSIEGSLKKNCVSIGQKERYAVGLKKLKAQLNEIISLDYFQAPQKEKAEQAVRNCKEIVEGLKVSPEKTKSVGKSGPVRIYDKNKYQGKTWVTRKGLHLDRIASGWLIRRFIDKEARFSFIREDHTVKNGIGFDVYNTDFSHVGEDCTFETLLKSFDFKDFGLAQLAEIVHDIDLKDSKFGRKEAEGVNQIIIGLSQRLKSDKKLLEKGMGVMDSLYQYYLSKERR